MLHNAARKHRLLIQFSGLAAVFSLIILVFFFIIIQYVHQMALDSAIQVITKSHDQIIGQLDDLYVDIENAAYTLNSSPTIQTFLEDPSTRVKAEQQSNLRSIYSSTFLLLRDLSGIAMFGTDGKYVYSSKYNVFSIDHLPEGYRNLTGSKIDGIFTPEESQNAYNSSYVYISAIYHIDSMSRLLGKKIGTTVLTFQTDELKNYMNSGSVYDGSLVLLVDGNNHPIVWNTNEATAAFDHLAIAELDSAFYLASPLDQYGWSLYSVLPKGIISSDMQPLIILTYVTGIILVASLAVFLIMLYRLILKPIYRLSGFMARVPEDTKPVRFKPLAENELGSMIRVMNNMLDAIETKNETLRKMQTTMLVTELSKKQMELVAYRNQINPHFLYNTLNCIRGMALYYNASEIVEISQSLSTMFRYVVQSGEYVTVAEELEYVKMYATIINYRFGGRISIEIDAEDETLARRTFKLSLQPVVENAVFHGLENKVGEGQIQISIVKRENRLLYSVADNGLGMNQEKLAELRALIDASRADMPELPTAERNIGLSNIARRLYLLYHDEGTIAIDSVVGEGTVVSICMPAELLRQDD